MSRGYGVAHACHPWRGRASRQRLAPVLFVIALGGFAVAGCEQGAFAPEGATGPAFDEVVLEEKEQLAGDPEKGTAEVGTCPDGYVLTPTKAPGTPPDDNGNGWICQGGDEKLELIDDVLKHADKGMKVNGHGNVVDKGKKIELQDISFSFHAIPTGEGAFAKGQFEFHDQANDLRVHGVVECLRLTIETSAVITGTVTRSNDKSLPEGTFVGWHAVDKGEPGAGLDAVSRLVEAFKGKGDCSSAIKLPVGLALVGGNIQIH